MIEDINKYITKLKENKPVIKAQKAGCVLARIGTIGEQIKTFVENGTLETVNCVKVDENGNPGIVITMANSDRKAVADKNGHTNTYIIPRTTFNKKYRNSEKVCKTEQFFEPAGDVQEFIQINEDIGIMASWGEIQNLKAGSYLNITNENDIYGIAYEEFVKTYEII